MSDFIIEISTCGSVTACTNHGGSLGSRWSPARCSGLLDDILDCTASGDCEPACRYVKQTYDIDWRMVKRIDGEYQNVTASAEDKRKVCEEIYFESESDFSDEELAEVYLIWQAAHDVARELEESEV